MDIPALYHGTLCRKITTYTDRAITIKETIGMQSTMKRSRRKLKVIKSTETTIGL